MVKMIIEKKGSKRKLSLSRKGQLKIFSTKKFKSLIKARQVCNALVAAWIIPFFLFYFDCLSLFRKVTILAVICQVGVGTCGTGGQPMTQFTQPDKLVYKRWYETIPLVNYQTLYSSNLMDVGCFWWTKSQISLVHVLLKVYRSYRSLKELYVHQ